MKGSRVQISDSAPGGVREKERITPSTAKSLMCQRHVRLFRFQASGESNCAQASASRPAQLFRPRKRPEMTPGRRDLRQAAGIKFGRRVFFSSFSIPLLRNGSPNEAPGPGRLKGNAVKIGNSSLCCKFLPPKRHIRPRQSLATGFHATGKASGPERVRRPAAAMVLQSRGKWIVIGRKNDFRHIPECKIRLLRNSGRTHAVRTARMRISGTSAKIG